MTPTGHDSDRLMDLVDGRLGEADEAAVRAHLASCETCAVTFAGLQRARETVRSLGGGPAMPASLEANISAVLDQEDAAGARRGGPGWWWLAAAAVVCLAAGVWWVARPASDVLVAQAQAQHDAIVDRGFSTNAWRSSDATTIENAFANSGATLPRIRVIDLTMMGWPLEGGEVVRIGSRTAALYAYRRPNGDRIVCQMYEGQLAELPTTIDVRLHRGFVFHVYERDGVTLVFWQEGRLVCVLASRLPQAEVVALAFEKAMAPR